MLAPRRLTFLALMLPGVAAAAPTAYGGPDTYGYYFLDSTVSGGPAYDATLFTSAATSGTLLSTASNADDSADTVTLPFTFTFYGTAYSTAYVCSDGYLSFSSTCTYSNSAFSTNTIPMIAPFWDDLDTRGSSSKVYAWTSGTAPYRTYNVVFVDEEHYSYTGNYGKISFAIQLAETTNDITFHFSDVTFEGTSGPRTRRGSRPPRASTVGRPPGTTPNTTTTPRSSARAPPFGSPPAPSPPRPTAPTPAMRARVSRSARAAPPPRA